MSLSLAEVPAALVLARQQLAQGDAALCQSICLDVLALGSDHAEAVVLLVEAMADGAGGLAVTDQTADAFLRLVTDRQQRARLEGILAYRRAIQMLRQSVPVFVARDWLHKARKAFETAGPERLDVRLRLAAIERLVAHNPSLA